MLHAVHLNITISGMEERLFTVLKLPLLVEKANDIFKWHLCKLTQETQDSCFKVLSIALLRAQTVPKKKGLSPFELSLWQTIFAHRHCHRSWSLKISYATQFSAFQQTLQELWEVTPDPASDSDKPLFELGTEVLIKTLESGGQSPEPFCESPYQVIASSLTAVKVPGTDLFRVTQVWIFECRC